jgi:hypothetical protein
MDRAYYSQRIGRGPLAKPTIEDLARALTLAVDEMWKRDYMQLYGPATSGQLQRSGQRVGDATGRFSASATTARAAATAAG